MSGFLGKCSDMFAKSSQLDSIVTDLRTLESRKGRRYTAVGIERHC